MKAAVVRRPDGFTPFNLGALGATIRPPRPDDRLAERILDERRDDIETDFTTLPWEIAIAWVSTTSAKGVHNVAPFSFFTAFGAEPIILGFAPMASDDREQKDTLANVRALGEFVINIATELLAQMDEQGRPYPPDVDEFVVAGLTPAPSVVATPPRIAESPNRLSTSNVPYFRSSRLVTVRFPRRSSSAGQYTCCIRMTSYATVTSSSMSMPICLNLSLGSVDPSMPGPTNSHSIEATGPIPQKRLDV